jgi:ribosomal-protein-alanine N-acetyltransferase
MKTTQGDITICLMTEKDLDEVLAIENASFPLPWNRDHFLDELKTECAFPLVALTPETKLAGYICPRLLLDEGHILDIAVHSDFRGRGVGRLLVERVLTDCREGGADFVSLEVRPSNTIAIALYRQMGFVETGKRKKYYENGEDALLMEYHYENEEADDAV